MPFAFRVLGNDAVLALVDEWRQPAGNLRPVAVVADAGLSDRVLDELRVDARRACFDRIASPEDT